MPLKEWTITFIQGKDAIKQSLISIDEGATLLAKYKDNKVQEYFLLEKLDDLHAVLAAAKKSDADTLFSVHVVCYNTEHNLKQLILRWKECALHQRLFFYFANPNSQTETKWVINPWLHSRVSDDTKLEQGLRSMFSMVEEWKGN